MKIALTSMTLMISLGMGGCAVAQDPSGMQLQQAALLPLRLDEVVNISMQGMTDELVIAEVERRGVSFLLTRNDFEQLRIAGMSEGLLRYLQGRASVWVSLRGHLLAGRYRIPTYAGLLYLGYPYLGYYDGLHSYGGGFQHGYYGGAHIGGHHGTHRSTTMVGITD